MTTDIFADADFDAMQVARLTRELKDEARGMGREEARFLVDAYYMMQGARIRAGNQISAGEKQDVPPMPLVTWLSNHLEAIEKRVAGLLQVYAAGNAVGEWSMSICGIGPIISAGLLAHIDITQAPTVGHIWRFAGLDPTVSWDKGEKRPWNADLKTLCWKIGESFVKFSNNEHDVYGHIWATRKAQEEQRNAEGLFAGQAAVALERKSFRKDTTAKKCYEQGILPPGHIHARAKRYAVKLFLAHFWEVWYCLHYQKPPPKPYVLEHCPGHVHKINPPNIDLVPEVREAWFNAREGDV